MHAPPETTAPDVEVRESWWDVIVHALRGTGGDPTQGPLNRAILLLAVPMVLEMVMESVSTVLLSFHELA
jgi:hypothetical protein